MTDENGHETESERGDIIEGSNDKNQDKEKINDGSIKDWVGRADEELEHMRGPESPYASNVERGLNKPMTHPNPEVHPREAKANTPLRRYVNNGMSQMETYIRESTYQMPSGVKEEEHLPDRMPELYVASSTNFDRTLREITSPTYKDPSAVSFDDLTRIIEADLTDKTEQDDSYNRLLAARKTAKDFLKDTENPRKVNVSLARDDDGEWEATTGVQRGQLYYTFTQSGLMDLNQQLNEYKYNGLPKLDKVRHARDIMEKINRGQEINDEDGSLQAIMDYVRKRKEEFKKNDAYYDLFDTFEIKVNAYKPSEANIN